MVTASSPPQDQKYRTIASGRHTAFMLLIQLGLAGWGLYLQQRQGAGDSVFLQNRNILPFYVSVITLEWLLVRLVWRGVRAKGIGLWEIIGGRWRQWKDAALDVAVCIPFLFVWGGAALLMHYLLGPSKAKSVATMLPRGAVEVLIWIAVSISAGICEEIVFRGYFKSSLRLTLAA